MSRYAKISALIALSGFCVLSAGVRAAPPAGAPSELKIGVVAFLSGPATQPSCGSRRSTVRAESAG